MGSRKNSTSAGSGITKEQHLKLKGQQKQYLDAKDKLEAQLLKLKEQREALKEDGAVHEDKIMKENHKLQKEVKARIQYILDVLGKMETALQQPIFEEEPPSRIRSPVPKKLVELNVPVLKTMRVIIRGDDYLKDEGKKAKKDSPEVEKRRILQVLIVKIEKK